MTYRNTVLGTFIRRPNRFIAHVLIDGKEEICHVKNTGRCRELLIPGVTLVLERAVNPNRKTPYSVIGVYKGDRLINMDSQAPNKAAGEWLAAGGLGFVPTLLRPETTYHSSRFDFYLETESDRAFMEVKGVTLEEDGAVYFPDAPTERGIKHILELARSIDDGYTAYILFVIQMEGASHFSPNDKTHAAFGNALRAAHAQGVHLLAYDCLVTPGTMAIHRPVPIRL